MGRQIFQQKFRAAVTMLMIIKRPDTVEQLLTQVDEDDDEDRGNRW